MHRERSVNSRETILRGNTLWSGETSAYVEETAEEARSEEGTGGRSRSRWSAVRYTPPQTYGAHCVPLGAHTPLGAAVLPPPSRYEPRYARLYRPYTMFLLWKGAREVTWKPSSRIQRAARRRECTHSTTNVRWMLTFRESRNKIDLHKRTSESRKHCNTWKKMCRRFSSCSSLLHSMFSCVKVKIPLR